MRAQIAAWVEESRGHKAPFGTPTLDGRPRFDMGEEHRPEKPALRRVNNPSDIAPAFADVAWNTRVVDMVADLIGPDAQFQPLQDQSEAARQQYRGRLSSTPPMPIPTTPSSPRWSSSTR